MKRLLFLHKQVKIKRCLKTMLKVGKISNFQQCTVKF